MQLQDESTIGVEAFVLRPAVPALASEQVLVPGAAGFHVVYANEGMELHVDS